MVDELIGAGRMSRFVIGITRRHLLTDKRTVGYFELFLEFSIEETENRVVIPIVITVHIVNVAIVDAAHKVSAEFLILAFGLIGYESYDWADPASFLKVQAFITGELAETLRRSNDQASGIMHFALMTWFRQTYDYQNIEPYPTYYALKRALQPVLVSAELWGRN